ncbi:MAG: ABC transporter substrate-binding protein [Clostridia bacterium]|nr:ABC transporter substrate-binding protein [Clostridia bacterium]
MHKTICRIVAVMAVVVLLVSCTACGNKTEGLQKVRVCEVTHSIFYAPQYAAIALGYFEEEGIQIELSNGQGADAVMSAVLSGNMDIGFAGPEAAVYVYNEGKEDYTEVFAQVTKRDGSFLVGRTPDEAFTWDKLKGKIVLPGRKGGVPYMTLEHVIRKNGLDPATDLTLDSSVQYALMTAAFTAGTGDYFTCFEPTASMLEAEGKGYIVAAVGDGAGDIPYTAYFAKKSYISENKDLITAFTRAIYKGQQWVKTHTAKEIAQTVASFFPDTDIELLTASAQSYMDIGAWCDTPVMNKDSFMRLQQVMQEAGELDSTAPFEKVVNNTYANSVI